MGARVVVVQVGWPAGVVRDEPTVEQLTDTLQVARSLLRSGRVGVNHLVSLPVPGPGRQAWPAQCAPGSFADDRGIYSRVALVICVGSGEYRLEDVRCAVDGGVVAPS